MKRLIALSALLLIGALTSFAQSGSAHSATLTWTAPPDAILGSSYNIYRASGACPAIGLGTLTFAKIGSTSTLTYSDTTITAGTYCFYVTQVQNGAESAPSTTAGGTAKPNTVTFSVTIQ